MKKLLLLGVCCLFLSCGKKEVSKYPIEVQIFSTNGYGNTFEVDSVVGKFAYRDGRKIELKRVSYIKFK